MSRNDGREESFRENSSVWACVKDRIITWNDCGRFKEMEISRKTELDLLDEVWAQLNKGNKNKLFWREHLNDI